MPNNNFPPPSRVDSTMISGIVDAAETLPFIPEGTAVGIGPNGGFMHCDNAATPPIDCVGVARSSGAVNDTIFVQINSIAGLPNLASNSFTKGHYVGDADNTGRLADLGNAPSGISIAGIYLGTNVNGTLKILIQPGFFEASGGGGAVTSVFARTGAVVAVSGDYTVGEVTGAAPLASPTFTGVPAAPTPAGGDNTTKIATTAFVETAIAPLAPLASPTFTGVPAAPTPATADSTTKLATTAFVHAVASGAVTSVFARTGAVVAAANDYASVPTLKLGDGSASILFSGPGAMVITTPLSMNLNDGAGGDSIQMGGGSVSIIGGSSMSINVAGFETDFNADSNGGTTFPGVITPNSSLVAGLPASPTAGSIMYATNGRKVGEGAGAGTGVVVYFSNGHWRVFSTDATVAA